MTAAAAAVDTARPLSELAGVAKDLCAVLEQENAALDRRDRGAAAALADEKTAAVRQFVARYSGLREATAGFSALSADDRQFLAAITGPVAALADENARRLQIAVEVGRRVMAAVSAAVKEMTPGPGTYSPTGSVQPGRNRAAAGARSLAVTVNTSL